MLRILKAISDQAKKTTVSPIRISVNQKQKLTVVKKYVLYCFWETESNNFPFPDTNIQHKRCLWNKKSVNKS